ncbi:hypothetical protein TNCV_1520921 [Trichonephila clavipes]|nr:hypothetical protein TNCV_1520921 [Trichonephila clavipes]
MPMQLQHDDTQLINRSNWNLVTSQSLGNHGPNVFYWREIWFVVHPTITDAPVCDAASRVFAAMVAELRIHAAGSFV